MPYIEGLLHHSRMILPRLSGDIEHYTGMYGNGNTATTLLPNPPSFFNFFFGSGGVRIDPGPPGPIKSGRGHPGDKIFTDFQVRGSILTDFHEFSRYLNIFGL